MAITERGFTGFESGANDYVESGVAQNSYSLIASGSTARTGSHFLRTGATAVTLLLKLSSSVTISTGGKHVRVRFYLRISTMPSTNTMSIFCPSGGTEPRLQLTPAGVLQIVDTRGGVNVGTLTADNQWHEINVLLDDHNVTMPAAQIVSIGGTPVTGSVYNFIGSGSQASMCMAASIDGGTFFGWGRDLPSATFSQFFLGGTTDPVGRLDVDDMVWIVGDAGDILPTQTHVYPVTIDAIASVSGFTGPASNVASYRPTLTSSAPFYSTAMAATLNGHSVRFSHLPVAGVATAIKVIGFLRKSPGGGAAFNAILDGATVGSYAAGSVPDGGTTVLDMPPLGYDWTSRSASMFNAVTFGIDQTANGNLYLGGLLLEVLTSSMNLVPVLLTITPDTGTWKGGTAFTCTGLHFIPSTIIKFDGVPANNLLWVDDATMKGTTPPHPSGADTVDVTAE